MANRLNEFACSLPFEQREVPAAAGKLILDLGEELAFEKARVAELQRRAAETNGDGWIACSDRMPTHGLKVMAYFLNKLGKGRTVFANHIEKFKERADNYEIDPDTPDDWFDTDESGESYIPEGWYENSETHEQELGITDEILFWRPLLSPPEQVKTSTEPACEKCKTLLAFEDDVCWACSKEER
jgi:hypothetical protein